MEKGTFLKNVSLHLIIWGSLKSKLTVREVYHYRIAEKLENGTNHAQDAQILGIK